MDSILRLARNPIDVFEETTRILLKIADNILSDPHNPKIRFLQKSNRTVAIKILQVDGGKESLIAMGFLENEHGFNLSMTDSLQQLTRIRDEINQLKNGNNVKSVQSQPPQISTSEEKIAGTSKEIPIKHCKNYEIPSLPPYNFKYNSGFLREIENNFQRALHYDNKKLQKAALQLIPVGKLEENAVKRLRHMQEQLKKEKSKASEIELQEFLILELLAWFKEDFFTWVDSPPCNYCNEETKFSHMSQDKTLMTYTSRIEMHICGKCNKCTPFHRYNDLSILLDTRRGRCGEWANTFTLFCRAMDWDARLVVDQTDHVWTEVYSFSQKRWLHCDPCENVCDSPLMYETGWAKKVSYVIAFSAEEIQDVTWRYTARHKEVLGRRSRCSEDELLNAITLLREERQQNLSTSRKNYLTKRLLSEIIELMVERKPDEMDKQERSSGALDWRKSRGEVSVSPCSKYTWLFEQQDLEGQCVTIRYTSGRNRYEKEVDGKCEVLETWEAGVFESANVTRKIENDWKKAYFSRLDSCNHNDQGSIIWKFKIVPNDYCFGKIEYKLGRFKCETGNVVTKLCSDETCVLLTDNSWTNDLNGKREISLTAVLSGGSGSNAWQHAQLCREDLNGDEFSFELKFYFEKK